MIPDPRGTGVAMSPSSAVPRRPVRVTLAEECELVTRGVTEMLASHASRVELVPPYPDGTPAVDVDITLHDSLADLAPRPGGPGPLPLVVRRGAGRLDLEPPAPARRAGARPRRPGLPRQEPAGAGPRGRAGGGAPRRGRRGVRPAGPATRRTADGDGADSAGGRGGRADHAGIRQRQHRPRDLAQHQLGEDLHPVGLPEDGCRLPLPGGAVGGAPRLPRRAASGSPGQSTGELTG